MNKLKNDLIDLKEEHQKGIRPNLHSTYNEGHEKIMELIDWTVERYKEATATNIKRTNRMRMKQ